MTAIRQGIYIPGVSSVVWEAMERFVTVLCDGAHHTEGEHAHEDVIALAYVMPPWLTFDWGAWPEMIREWYRDGRAPSNLREFWARFGSEPEFAADIVAGAVADGLDDGLLVLTEWDSGTCRERFDQASADCIAALVPLAPTHGERLRQICVERRELAGLEERA